MFGQNEAEDRIKEALDSGDLDAVNDLSLGFARRLGREFQANSLCIITAFDADLSLPRCVELLHSLEEFLRGAGVLSLKFVGMWCVPEREASAQFQAGQILPEPSFCCIGITLPVVRMIAEKYHHPALYLGPETNDQVVVVPIAGDSRLIGEFDPAGMVRAYTEARSTTFEFVGWHCPPQSLCHAVRPPGFPEMAEKRH